MSDLDPDGADHAGRAAPPDMPWLRTTPDPLNLAPSDIIAAPAPPPAPRRGRRGWWLAAAGLALLGCLGAVLLSPADRPAAPDVAPPPAVPSPAPTTQAPETVVYEVASGGKGEKARVEFTDEDRDIIRIGEVSLPWRHTFRTDGERPPLVLLAQRRKGGTSPVTCSITVDGKTLTTAVQEGRSAAPQCSA